MTGQKVVEKEIVSHGESLPCHQTNVLHTERRRDGLEVWYVDTEEEE